MATPSQGVVEFTRPANTTAYTALDAVTDHLTTPTVLEFTNIAPVPGLQGYITGARIMTDKEDCTSQFRLHIFNEEPSVIPNDNAAFTLKYADVPSYLGCIDFEALGTEGTGSDVAYAFTAGLLMAYACAGASQTLYGLLETVDGFTPASEQKFTIGLIVDRL